MTENTSLITVHNSLNHSKNQFEKFTKQMKNKHLGGNK
jgi:hypothetical protein